MLKILIRKLIYNYCPKIWLFHKIFSLRSIRAHCRYVIPQKFIARAESDWLEKERVVNKYSKKHKKTARSFDLSIENFIARALPYQERKNDVRLRTDIRFCQYAYGFLPEEYLMYNLENRTESQRREYISDFERLKYVFKLNPYLYCDILDDKFKAYQKFMPYYKRETIAISTSEHYDIFKKFVAKHPVFVKKMAAMSLGISVALLDMEKCGKTEAECFNEMIKEGKHILEERVIQSKTLAALNPSSVNTVRIVTYNTKNGVVIPNGLIRTGRDGMFVDNGGAGGILTGVDFSNGKLSTDGYTKYGERFEKHPDTGIHFKGYQLPELPQLLEICKEMAAMVPYIKYISWDMAHTDRGWVAIEGNFQGYFFGRQSVYGRGLKREIEDLFPVC